MTDKLTVPILKKRLDILLKAVRFHGTKDGVTNHCATCSRPIVYNITDLQCGHFVKRGDLRLKYDKDNLMPQCRRCNHFLDGAQDKAALYIVDNLGVDTLRRLVETDKQWLNGLLPPLKRSEYVDYYNEWLEHNRWLEQLWGMKLIPASWKPTE